MTVKENYRQHKLYKMTTGTTGKQSWISNTHWYMPWLGCWWSLQPLVQIHQPLAYVMDSTHSLVNKSACQIRTCALIHTYLPSFVGGGSWLEDGSGSVVDTALLVITSAAAELLADGWGLELETGVYFNWDVKDASSVELVTVIVSM